MTVWHEENKSKKYKYLWYVEFLEFLCRISLELEANIRAEKKYYMGINHKVETLLKMVFEYRQEQGIDEVPVELFERDDSSSSETEENTKDD